MKKILKNIANENKFSLFNKSYLYKNFHINQKILKNSFSFNKNQRMFFSIIGIDIGGSNTCMSILEQSGPRVIENAEGLRTTPSFVSYFNEENPEEKIVVAINSKKQAVQFSKNSFYGLKYLLSNSEDIVNSLISKKRFPYEFIIEEKGETLTDKIKLKTDFESLVSPIDASSEFLKYCKQQADGLLGKNIKKTVVAVPNFINENDNSKSDLKKALNLCGLEPIYFIDESKSSIIAYGVEDKKKILVFNLGGTSFNLTYLEKKEEEIKEEVKKESKEDGEEEKNEVKDPIKEVKSFEIKEIFTDYFLGGEDIDTLITNVLVEEFNKKNKVDIRNEPYGMQRIKEAAEVAKVELTLSNQVEINLPFLMADVTGPKHLQTMITRSKFERYIDDFLSKLKKHLESFKQKLIENDKNVIDNIDQILIVGGVSRIPCVQDLIKQVFKKEPNRNLNPEEAPSIGACIIADTLKSKSEEKVSFNTLPLSIGIETLGGKFSRLIKKDTQLPYSHSFKLSTVYDNQPTVNINFFMGERELAKDNKLLGNIDMKIPLAKKGSLTLEVIVKVDESGILHLKLVETTLSKKSVSYSLDLNNGLNPEILEDIVSISNQFKEVDEMNLNSLELRNEIDEFLYVFENHLKQLKKDNLEDEEDNEESAPIINLINKSEEIKDELSTLLSDNTNLSETDDIIKKYGELQGIIEELGKIMPIEE